MIQFFFTFEGGNLWQLIVPVGVMAIIVPAYFFLKREKANSLDEDDEEFFE